MSIDSNLESLAVSEMSGNGSEPVPPEAPPVAVAMEEPPAALVATPEPAPAPQVEVVTPARSRPRWAVPAAIAAAGLIASGSLGYLFYTTSNKLDATRHQLTVTQLSLDATGKELAAANADAADKKVTADYVKMYTANAGAVRTDYGQVVACNSYATCRFAAQQALTDLQAFQSARQTATVPSGLSASDGALGDSVSAGIAALQELISGMDNDNAGKVKDGFSKLDDAMLSMAKAESSLGSELQ